MLRITRSEGAEGTTRLHLEGRLGAAEIALVESALRARDPREVALDLSELRAVDAPARAWLERLIARGAQISASTPFLQRLLETRE